MNRRFLAAQAAAFSLILAGTGTASAQLAAPAPAPGTAPAPMAAPRPDGPAPMAPAAAADDATAMAPAPAPQPRYYVVQGLPAVYAPGPGYGQFTRAPKEMICYSMQPAPAPGGPLGALSGPAAYAAVGLISFWAAAAVF